MISCTRHFSLQSSITSAVPHDPNFLDSTTTQEDEYSQDSMDTESSGYGDYDSEDEDDVHSDDGCDECKRRRHVALLDSLPSTVISGIHAVSIFKLKNPQKVTLN